MYIFNLISFEMKKKTLADFCFNDDYNIRHFLKIILCQKFLNCNAYIVPFHIVAHRLLWVNRFNENSLIINSFKGDIT